MIIAVMDRKYVNNKKTDDTYDDSIDLSDFEESLLLDDNNSTNDETSFNKMNVDYDYSQLNIELNFEEEDIDIQKDKKRYESDDYEENEEKDLDWNSVFSCSDENLNLGSNNHNRIYNSTEDDDYLCSSSFENDTQNTSNMKNANLNNNNNLCKSSFDDSTENIYETTKMNDNKFNSNLSSNEIQLDNSNEINYSNEVDEKVKENLDSHNNSNKQLLTAIALNNINYINDPKRINPKIFFEQEN